MSEIPKEELALYDRQIRLWGLEAQKKLREGSVLIISSVMSNTVQEICKNLALCGISSLNLQLKTNDCSEKLIYLSLETELIEIHPRLNFNCSVSPSSLNFSDYDFIIVCGYDYFSDFVTINENIRALEKCCSFCFEVEGKYFLFNDFGEFTLNSTAGPNTIIFPSFASVVNLPQMQQKNYLLESFYKILKDDHGLTVQHDSDIAGSAIVAALVSQEVIKSFSKTSHPINNLLIFDSKNLKNIVTRVGIIS